MTQQTQNIHVTFHLGADKSDIENATPSSKISELKAKAMDDLEIVATGGVEYHVQHEGKTVTDEAQDLNALTGGKNPKHVTFHLKKVLTGGA